VPRHFSRLLFPFLLTATVAAAAWPERSTDLQPDPAIRRGTLANGLRYVILPHGEPPAHISMRLVVLAGSLQERDDERGLAHFIEHMAFRGTRHHPDGSMTTELQHLGIGFGPDSAAFTSYDHTIYHLELPDAKETTLRQGLGVFREYASEVSFTPKLIERERGIVLSELNMRNTPGARIARANLAFLWPGSRQAARDPIGLEESIRHFNRAQFVAFYDAWYRPDRMAVIIVGEVSSEQAERLITQELGPLQPRGPVRPDGFAPIPATASKPDIRICTDPGIVGASCTFEHPYAATPPETHAERVKALHTALAFTMFQRRLAAKSNGVKSDFVDPTAAVTQFVPGWDLATFGVAGTLANWKEFMTDVEREHRSAFLHGFTESELTAAKALFKTGYEEAVRTYPTQLSSGLAGMLADALVEGNVVSTPATWVHDLTPALADANVQDCGAAFRDVWTQQAPHVFIVSDPKFAITRATVATALNESREWKVTAPVETKPVEFAYTNFGEPSAPSHITYAPDLDVTLAEFPNGTRLNFKPTAFEADMVQVYLRVGDGRQSQPESKPGLDYLANSIVSRGGLRRHSFNELQMLASGRSFGLSFYVDNDSFAFNARCARRDLEFCLQVITAHLTDSAYRPEAMREINASFGSMYSSLASAAGGPISCRAERILAQGDRRFGVPEAPELFARTPAEVITWVEPQFKHGPIELSIVGDTNWAEAQAAVSRTLAALPKRDPRHPDPEVKRPRLAKPPRSGFIYTTAPQLRLVALARFCVAPDVQDIYQERRCRLLAGIIDDRLRVRLREELGAAYSSTAMFVQHEGFPALTYFELYAEVAPEQARPAALLIRKELDSLSKKHFSVDEFDRAKQPFLRVRQDDLRSNAYWGYTVLRDAQQHPERLIAARDRSADTAGITQAEVEKLAQRYLNPDRSFEFVAYPSVNSR
jgi:zinc protease